MTRSARHPAGEGRAPAAIEIEAEFAQRVVSQGEAGGGGYGDRRPIRRARSGLKRSEPPRWAASCSGFRRRKTR